MTLEIDDAGVGDLLHGMVVGAYRLETDEFFYDMVDVEFFQPPLFHNKAYLIQTSAIVKQLVERMKILDGEQIVICGSFVFERAIRDLEEKYGTDRVIVSKITGNAQMLVETAYQDELRNLGYVPVDEREKKRAKSFFHMLQWLKEEPSRLRFAKTGWPRLRRYVNYRKGASG